MAISPNFRDRDKQSFKENAIDSGTDRRTCDITTHSKLDLIATGLGVSDTTATTINKAIPFANTEVSQALPASTIKFRFRSRKKARIQLAYSVGDSGILYTTIPPGNVFIDLNFYLAQTIFFQSTKAGDTLEIIAYV